MELIVRIRRMLGAYKRAGSILCQAPAGVVYILLGGVCVAATIWFSYEVIPFVVVGLGFDPSFIAARVGPGYLLAVVFAIVVFLLAVCVWLPFKAAAVRAIGTRLHTGPSTDSPPPLRDIWRPLLTWAIIKALASRSVELLVSRIAHTARGWVVPGGRTDYDDWRIHSAFLTPAIVLDGYTDLEAAATHSRGQYTVVDEMPDVFSTGVYATLGFATVTAIASLLRAGSTEEVTYVYAALFGFPAVCLVGFSIAAAVAVALRTNQYVVTDTPDDAVSNAGFGHEFESGRPEFRDQ